MIITTYGLVVFYLVSWIDFDITKPAKAVKYICDMLGFAYPAIPTRHEVSEKTGLVVKWDEKMNKPCTV